MSRWIKTPSGSFRTRRNGYVAMILTGTNTFTGKGKYRHANIRPPLSSNAVAHIELSNYKTLRDLKADCVKVMDALRSDIPI